MDEPRVPLPIKLLATAKGSAVYKLRAGQYRLPVTIICEGKRLFFKFRFHKGMMAEIKSMQGARWHGFEKPPVKMWSIDNCARNLFQLSRMAGEKPYARFDTDLIDVEVSRPLYAHQLEMLRHALTRRMCIFACEMGTGKTLAAIETMERANIASGEVWYVGPKSGVKAVKREFIKWDCKIEPRWMTYAGLVSVMKEWIEGEPAPRMVIFDESSKVKTPTSQRSQAALALANFVREEHPDDGYIVCMSGTPAPKVPTDWWHQCEVAYPGFVKEGTIGKFKMRLCIIENRENMSGGVYPHIVTWLDDKNKCAICGEYEEGHTTNHTFKESKNEVEYLYKRLKGLVLVKFKKECLDLPEKQYIIKYAKPEVDVLRTAKSIRNTAPRVITALTLLRELSDGFQYTDEEVGKDTCTHCKGTGRTESPEQDGADLEIICDACGGVGSVPRFVRGTIELGSPKDALLIEELEMHEDVGRLVVWAGFTGSIDRVVAICHKYGWATLRVDGRGYEGIDALGETVESDTFLDAMDLSHPRFKMLLERYPKLCYVGHPQAGGMALTLTGSPTEVYYSNDFNGEARMQSEDRFHRAGMDTNRGARVVDFIHLPTDELVLNNLKQKKKLQALSMGDLEAALNV